MAMRFTDSLEASLNQGVKMLVHGPSGVGKTELCSTAPDPLLISIERGLLTIAHKRIPVIEIENLKDLAEAHAFVSGSAEMKNFQCIGLDSWSDIIETVMLAEKRRQKDGRKAYGEVADIAANYVRKFRDIRGKHVIFTAKQDKEKDEASGLTLRMPSMPSKTMTRDLPHFFDEVFAMDIAKDEETGEDFRYLRTRLNNQFLAKDRSGALDDLEFPDLTNIITKITDRLSANAQ